MSARRKHVRSHVHDVDVEIVSEEGDAVCRVEEVKGGNMIEVCMRFFFLLLVVCGARRGATFKFFYALFCTAFADDSLSSSSSSTENLSFLLCQVTKPDDSRTLVRIPSRFANIYYVRRGSFILCTGFASSRSREETTEERGGSKQSGEKKRILFFFTHLSLFAMMLTLNAFFFILFRRIGGDDDERESHRRVEAGVDSRANQKRKEKTVVAGTLRQRRHGVHEQNKRRGEANDYPGRFVENRRKVTDRKRREEEEEQATKRRRRRGGARRDHRRWERRRRRTRFLLRGRIGIGGRQLAPAVAQKHQLAAEFRRE